MGAVLLSFWCQLGEPKVNVGYPVRVGNGFGRQKKEKAWKVGCLCLFWVVWKARNKIAVKDEIFSIQTEKTFIFLLWLETKKSIWDGLLTITGFIDRVGCK